MSIIPESSPIPKLSFSFSSEQEMLDMASEFSLKIFEFLNSNQFSLDLQCDLDLIFNDIGVLTDSYIENFEAFFSGGFLGLKSSQMLENLEFLVNVLKKHKNYITSLSISLAKLKEEQLLKKLMDGLISQNNLTSIAFQLSTLNSDNSAIFFSGLLGFSSRLTSLSLNFSSSSSITYNLPVGFWSNFKFLRKIQLTFSEYNVPSATSFFDGFHDMFHLIDLEICFKSTTINKELLMSFLAEFSNCDFNALQALSLDFWYDMEGEVYGTILENIEKKFNKLLKLSLGFNKSSIFVSICFKRLIDMLRNLAKNQGKLEVFGLKLIDCNLTVETDIAELGEVIGALDNLKSLEINFTNNKMAGVACYNFIAALKKMQKTLKSLYIFFGWNNVNDENGRLIFKELENFTELEYFILDISQNYSGSTYMNGNLNTDLTNMLKKLIKMKVILINLEGNEFKENHYIEIEDVFREISKSELLRFQKVFRKSEIYGVSQTEPNLTYFEEYLHHFTNLLDHIGNKEYNLINSIILIDFNNCFFGNVELLKSFQKVVKTLRSKTSNETFILKIKNPPLLDSSTSDKKSPLSELFVDQADLKNPFTKIEIIYTSLFQTINPYNIKILNSSINKPDLSIPSSIEVKETLNYLNGFNAAIITGLIGKYENYMYFLKNKTFAYNLTTTIFEEIYYMIPKQEIGAQKAYINYIFMHCLLGDIYSKIPGYILSQEEFSIYISPESISILNLYCKTLNSLENPNHLCITRIHIEKLKLCNTLKLYKNPNFSTKIWKNKFFEVFEKNWKAYLLKTPKDFYKNEYFEVCGEGIMDKSAEKADQSLDEGYKMMTNILMQMDLPELNGFYIGFLEELLENMKYVENIDFSEILTKKELKDRFSNKVPIVTETIEVKPPVKIIEKKKSIEKVIKNTEEFKSKSDSYGDINEEEEKKQGLNSKELIINKNEPNIKNKIKDSDGSNSSFDSGNLFFG